MTALTDARIRSPTDLEMFARYNCIVTLSLCPRAYFENLTAKFSEYSVYVDCGRGSVFLCWSCDTLCSSGFLDYVMFSHNGSYGELYGFICGESVIAENYFIDSVRILFSHEDRQVAYTSWVAPWA